LDSQKKPRELEFKPETYSGFLFVFFFRFFQPIFLWEKFFFLASLKNPPLSVFFSEAKKKGGEK
jgi:hypothetical protein